MSDSDLTALVRKYRTLQGIRLGAIDVKKEPSILRALAEEFPGALRELDCVPDEGLEARLRDVLGASEGQAVKTWILWMLAYHRMMRQVLSVRRHLLEARGTGESQINAREPAFWAAVAERVTAELGEPCEPALVPEVLNPPAGRLNRFVFDALGKRFECSGDELEAVLFPALVGQAYPATPH